MYKMITSIFHYNGYKLNDKKTIYGNDSLQ